MRRVLLTIGLIAAWAAFGLNTATVYGADPPGTVTMASPVTAPITLAKPAMSPNYLHRAAGYLHADNCRLALVGGNGDNDVQAWINQHTPYGIVSYAPLYAGPRYGNNAVIYYYDLYQAGNVYWGNQAGYGSPPAGW